ncbi:MAG: hypothetical protein DMG43_03545 [Acidobacteria bacterium]|nr:MAG: hypothetical protein DMG43_03545 [Acidobacteriota bacterium]
MFRSRQQKHEERKRQVKLLIAGGGTGGHVFPALAIAKEWMSRGTEREVVLVGTERGIEMKLVPQAGLPLETLRVAGLKGKGGATLLKNVAMLGPAIVDARRVWRWRLRRGADAARDLAGARTQCHLRTKRRAGSHEQGTGANFCTNRDWL